MYVMETSLTSNIILMIMQMHSIIVVTLYRFFNYVFLNSPQKFSGNANDV